MLGRDATPADRFWTMHRLAARSPNSEGITL